MKLSEVHFFLSGTVIIHFLDKLYQGKKVKSALLFKI